MLSRLLLLSVGPRAKWIMLALWLIPVVALANFSIQFNNVQSDNPALFTPSGAESTQATTILQNQFPDGRLAQAIVVYQRPGGLTAADRARMRAAMASFHGAGLPPGVQPPTADPPAANGTVASLSMAMQDSDATKAQQAIDSIRARVGHGGDGLTIRVTGPAAFLVDTLKSFSSIDGLILGITVSLVLVLLLLIYRSPILPLLPLACVGAAYMIVAAILYLLATHAGLTVDGQSASVLPVLMFGAGTDYALLLVARYREELHVTADRHAAMADTLRKAGPALLSSGSTVLAAMLTLLLATLRSTHNLGPILAIGIAFTLLAGLTLFPALLQIAGPVAFWPATPKAGGMAVPAHTFWRRVGEFTRRRPRPIAAVVCVALLLGATGVATSRDTLNFQNGFISPPESVQGFDLIKAAEPAGLLSPTVVIARPVSALPAVMRAAHRVPGVAPIALPPALGSDGYVEGLVVFTDDPYGPPALARISVLRQAVHAAAPPGATVLVGGETAIARDTNDAANRDLNLIAPVLLLVILIILSLLLRSVVAPLYLILTVVLSFFASLGISVYAFRYLFGFAGIESDIPTFVFLFLVALGVDYNIFLISRVREESLTHGTAQGMLRGLAATGGIITSAGLILAGTFSVLAVLPLKQLVEIGFAVAFGILLDTVVVRSILVPALVFIVNERSWWPSRLAQSGGRDQPVPISHETVA
ncbi:MAG TPA: MMPL family transporter [Chloroflexota bacterium]|nr:MMPL family transporter [Chloroflexota bacterium]